MGAYRLVHENEDPLEHLRQAKGVVHPSLADAEPDETWKLAVNMYKDLRADIVRWRSLLYDELSLLLGNMQDEIDIWWETLPSHVHAAYNGKGGRDNMIAAPLFRHLLRAIKYPQSEIQFDELSFGYQVTGDIVGGVGWPKRDTPKPDIPLSMVQLFAARNPQ